MSGKIQDLEDDEYQHKNSMYPPTSEFPEVADRDPRAMAAVSAESRYPVGEATAVAAAAVTGAAH